MRFDFSRGTQTIKTSCHLTFCLFLTWKIGHGLDHIRDPEVGDTLAREAGAGEGGEESSFQILTSNKKLTGDGPKPLWFNF